MRAILAIEMCDCECKNCKKANVFGVPGHEFHACLKVEAKEVS